MWFWDVQRIEHQHRDASMYASGSQHELRSAQLRGLERVQLQRYLCADRDAVEDGDELQLQLRQWTVRGIHQHRDTGLLAQHDGHRVWHPLHQL